LTIDETDELGDSDSADLFTETSRGIDKWLWFVEAYTQADRYGRGFYIKFGKLKYTLP
jgi:hypothetical protein